MTGPGGVDGQTEVVAVRERVPVGRLVRRPTPEIRQSPPRGPRPSSIGLLRVPRVPAAESSAVPASGIPVVLPCEAEVSCRGSRDDRGEVVVPLIVEDHRAAPRRPVRGSPQVHLVCRPVDVVSRVRQEEIPGGIRSDRGLSREVVAVARGDGTRSCDRARVDVDVLPRGPFMVHLQHEDLLDAVRVALVRPLSVRLRAGLPGLGEVHAAVQGICPAIRVPPEALIACLYLRERLSGIVRHRDIRCEFDVEGHVDILAAWRDHEDRLVVVGYRAVHRERSGPRRSMVGRLEQYASGIERLEEDDVHRAVGGDFDLWVELPAPSPRERDRSGFSPRRAAVLRRSEEDCGARATGARLRGVDVRDGLVDVRGARIGGDRGFPVRAASGERLLRIERGRRPHRGCRGVERCWRKNEERDGQRGPCQVDPDRVPPWSRGGSGSYFTLRASSAASTERCRGLGLQSASLFTNVVWIRPSGQLYRKVLGVVPRVRAMAGMTRTSAGGRALVVVGALMLFGSLFFFTWFVVSGTRPDLPSGRYNGIGSTGLLNTLLGGPWGWIAFVWLVVSAFLGLGVAALGRKTRRLGTAGMVVLLLYALFLVVVPTYLNPQGSTGTVSVSFAYGFVVAVLGSALVEAGARLPRAAFASYQAPTAAEWDSP